MKVKFCVRCNGLNNPIVDEWDCPDDSTEKDLEEQLQVHISNYVDSWYEILD